MTSTEPLFWRMNLDRTQALDWVAKKFRRATNFQASLYYHPMAGVEFDWCVAEKPQANLHLLVDRVNGTANSTAPWTAADFTTAPAAIDNDHAVSSPLPHLEGEDIIATARKAAHILLTRNRRLGGAGNLRPTDNSQLFGKPNWWITGTHRGRPVELILDAVTAKHYVFNA